MTIQVTNRARKVVKQEMNLTTSAYLPAILSGMATTFKHIFKRPASVRYPEVKRAFSPVYRGVHILARDEEGRERCTACGLCALSCPAEAITMDSAERKPEEAHLYREEKYASRYEINMLRCIFCGLCEEACPKAAIFLSDSIATANYGRKDFIYGKDKLVEPIQKPEKHINVFEEGRRTTWFEITGRDK